MNIAGHIRELVEHALSGDLGAMCETPMLVTFEKWAADNSNARKVIMEVVKARLDMGWPYDYKALDLLGVMPLAELVGLSDKLKVISETPSSTTGSSELKKIAKPLLDKAMAELRRQEDEEARKKQEAITAMWGGLWANEIGRPAAASGNGWDPWPSSNGPVLGGGMAQAKGQRIGQGAEGWQPWVIAPTAPTSTNGAFRT